jgi:hypothetical protein
MDNLLRSMVFCLATVLFCLVASILRIAFGLRAAPWVFVGVAVVLMPPALVFLVRGVCDSLEKYNG